MLFLLLVYLPKKKILGRLVYLTPLLPLIVYAGIRLNPTLNPDNKIWGKFDYDFANYLCDLSRCP